MADCENQLIRDTSRGLDGGSFYCASLLNRKDAKMRKGKEAIEELNDFFILKSHARFCHLLIKKYKLNKDIDNTPTLLRKADPHKKARYIHDLVADVLRDLLPDYSKCEFSNPQLHDFPLSEGRKSQEGNDRTSTTLAEAEETCGQNMEYYSNVAGDLISMSGSSTISYFKSKKGFNCSYCKFTSKFEAVCKAHVKICKSNENTTSDQTRSSEKIANATCNEPASEDMYWNYKNAEFFLDSHIAIA